MKTKNQPATPLKIVGEVQMKKIQHDMTVLRRTNERLLAERSKLVEALRRFTVPKKDTHISRVEAAAALLRELGEAS